MAMRKNDVEQDKTKTNKEESDDFFDDESESDDTIEEIELKTVPGKDLAARKRLEDYLEEKRLRKQLGDDLLDFE